MLICSDDTKTLIEKLNFENEEIKKKRKKSHEVPDSNQPSTSSASPKKKSTREKFFQALHAREKRQFYGDDNVYMIIRLHHILMDRLSKIVSAQAVLDEEHLEIAKKNRRWEEGAGAEQQGRKVLEEMVKTRRDAVNDIKVSDKIQKESRINCDFSECSFLPSQLLRTCAPRAQDTRKQRERLGSVRGRHAKLLPGRHSVVQFDR